MRLVLWISLAVTIAACSRAGGPSAVTGAPLPPAPRGDSFNNGGGYPEQWMTYAWLNLDGFLSGCLEATSCASAKSRVVLDKIREALPEERQRGGLRFASGMHGELLSTGTKVGDEIVVGVDALDPEMDLAEAVGWLVLGLSRHQRVGKGDDTLREALTRFWRSKSESVSLARFGRPEIQVMAIGGSAPGKPFVSNALLLTDSHRLFDLASFFRERFACPSGAHPVASILGGLIPWQRPEEAKGEATIEVQARYSSFLCDGGARLYKAAVFFRLRFRAQDDGWVWQPEASRVRLELLREED